MISKAIAKGIERRNKWYKRCNKIQFYWNHHRKWQQKQEKKNSVKKQQTNPSHIKWYFRTRVLRQFSCDNFPFTIGIFNFLALFSIHNLTWELFVGFRWWFYQFICYENLYQRLPAYLLSSLKTIYNDNYQLSSLRYLRPSDCHLLLSVALL